MLSDIGQHKIVMYRRRLVQTRLTEFALDVVLSGKAVATMAIETGIGRLPGGFGTEVFRYIRFSPTRLTGIEQGCGLEAHKVRRCHRHMSLGDGKLHTLISADGFAEDDAIFR